ncbi:MAG: succinylglutamate desuccinylase/aspartoacylase family protein [Verrucomicrobiota bacterium]
MTDLHSPALDLTIERLVSAPRKPGQVMKVGIFAGIHGDEEAGCLAAHELARWASDRPPEVNDFELHFFPVCNPSGISLRTRHSHSGLDLNRQFWCDCAEPEIIFLEAELRRECYDGIISLHSDDTSDGCYGFVSGDLLSAHLLEPALQAASEFLPRNELTVIDGFHAEHGIIKEGYLGILRAPPDQRPHALEIVFETPALAPLDLQVQATVAAVKSILAEYRELQAYAANL